MRPANDLQPSRMFPFLIGKVLTKIPHGGIPVEDSGVFPFLTGKVLTVNDFRIHKIMHEDGSGERFPFLLVKLLTLKQLGFMYNLPYIGFHSL